MAEVVRRRVLIHVLAFSPDGVSTAYLYNDIANGLLTHGFNVSVLTSTPHYNLIPSTLKRQPLKKKCLGLYYRSLFGSIPVYHIPLKKYDSAVVRIFSFLYWHAASFFLAMRLGKIDVVVSPSPPLSIGLVSILIARLKRAKAIYNVQEIYPDFLIKYKDLKSPFIIGALNKLEQYVYNKSDMVITIDQFFYNKIILRFRDQRKLRIIPNFVDTELYRPLPSEDIMLSKTAEENALTLLYAGNIGHAQDWTPVLYAAEKLGNSVAFRIIGEGVQKDELVKQVRFLGLTNIEILPYQEREKMPQLYANADIHFIVMNEQMEEDGFPSKVYTIMACAKPMIIATGRTTPLYNFLSDKHCAVLVTDNRLENFVLAIECLKDIELRTSMGQAGLKVIEEKYSKEKVLATYAATIIELWQK